MRKAGRNRKFAGSFILTAGCAKYRYNKLDLGDIGGIPRILDAGQCNDCYSLVVIALKLKEVFELDDINDLPISYDIAWYEQKAVAIFDVKCPECGHKVEFFKDDTTRKCGNCGHRFLNPAMDFGCASYCRFAEQCLGNPPVKG